MNLQDAFSAINREECFGYSPVSSSTKPAHIANGWFRRLLGTAYDPALLNDTVVHWIRNKEEHPSDALLTDHALVFEPFRPMSKRREFTDFRADLKALVSPFGGAVNNGNARSSYNITHRQHLTKDIADNSVGAFLQHLIQTDLGSGPSPLLEVLRNTLDNPVDEVSILTQPLVRNCEQFPVTEGTYHCPDVFRRRTGQFVSPVLRSLRRGFDQLACFEEAHGGGLPALRRAVAFGVFAVLLHMANRHREKAAATGLIPHLLYFQGRRRTTVYQASHYTYSLARQAIESLYTLQLRQRVVDRVGPKPSPKKCQQFIDDIVFKAEQDKRRQQLHRIFLAYRGQMEAADALAEGLRDVLFRNLTGTPVDFYRSLGVRGGFLRPAGNSATRKFYTLEGVLLEAILASILTEGRLTFREFLTLLHDRYGLFTGGRPEDAKLLFAQGIGQATVEDLRANAVVFRQQLLALGWASQYADGVLYVHLPEGTT